MINPVIALIIGLIIGVLFTVLVFHEKVKTLRREIEVIEERKQRELMEKISKARKDAIKRSTSVVTGLVAEKLAPYITDFPCNPRDCRFIGSPVDYVCFNGLSEGNVKEVILIEIKHGKSQLSKRESSVMGAVKDKHISYKVINVRH